MWTLHSYFGRELLKNFVMTCSALTILIVMGGGVSNIFQSEGLGAREMMRIFIYLTPFAITLILPVSALFSATITFGRAAADNEILACQAAGINLHRLLVTPALLGIFTTIATFFSWNFVIPYLTAEIAAVTRRDLPAIVLGQFQKSKPLVYGKFQISAKRCDKLSAENIQDLPEEYHEGHTLLRLSAVTFSEVDEFDYVRYGTADEAYIDFDATAENPRVMLQLQGVKVFDAVRKQFYAMKSQRMGPKEIPFPLKRKLKFENLFTLYSWLQDPKPGSDKPSWLMIPEIQDMMHGMNREVMVVFMDQELDKAGGSFKLIGRGGATIDVSVDEWASDADDGRFLMRNVTAKVAMPGKPVDVYHSSEGVIELRGNDEDSQNICVSLSGEVSIQRENARPDDPVVKKPKEELPRVPFSLQPKMYKRYQSFDAVSLFENAGALPLVAKQERLRKKLVEKQRTYLQEILGELHFRATYSVDGIAIILLGAMLGIIVRNGQVLTAFGLSCVPMVFVIIACITGRNLADQPGLGMTAVFVMWGATAILYGATCFIGIKVLKR